MLSRKRPVSLTRVEYTSRPAKKSRQAVPKVPRKLLGELKYFDKRWKNRAISNSLAFASGAGTGAVTGEGAKGGIILNDILQGAAEYQRIGRKVRNKSVQIKLSIYPGDSADEHSHPIRVLLVWDKSPNGVAPARNDILNSAVYETGEMYVATDEVGAWASFKSLRNADRFEILRDYTFQTPTLKAGNYVASTTSEWKFLDWYVPLKGRETTYASSAQGIGSIATGALYLLIMSDSQLTHWVNDCGTRLRYEDA